MDLNIEEINWLLLKCKQRLMLDDMNLSAYNEDRDKLELLIDKLETMAVKACKKTMQNGDK